MHYDNTTSNLPHRRYYPTAAGAGSRRPYRNCCDYHRSKRRRQRFNSSTHDTDATGAAGVDDDTESDADNNVVAAWDVDADYSGSDDDDDIYSVSGVSFCCFGLLMFCF